MLLLKIEIKISEIQLPIATDNHLASSFKLDEKTGEYLI